VSGELATAGLGALFLAALVAATLLPAQSELMLTAMLLTDRWEPVVLVAIATAGNVAGSTVNWLIGRFLSDRRDARWFPVPAAALARAEQRFQRFGLPVLLLSWVPIIGDPITLVAGLLRVRPLPFLVIVTIAKGARYAVLAAIVLGVVRW
jgi:membrane protein YqaA with SNARE-associated domain